MSVQNVNAEREELLNQLLPSARRTLEEIGGVPGWDVELSKHPLKERVTVTLSAEVGVLTYYVRVEPEESAPARNVSCEKSWFGYRIERWHSATLEDGEETIEDGVYGQLRAFEIARKEMRRLTE